MKAFQLDECFNDKRVAANCNAAGKSEVRRWPKELSGQDDDVWFPDVLTRDAPVVTTDVPIALDEKNRRALPANNTGIILVRPKTPRHGFGSKEAAAVLAVFKAAHTDWSEMDWSNVYVEINEVDVYVCHFKDATLEGGIRIAYDEKDFSEKFSQAILDARTISLGGQNAIQA